MTEKKRWFQMKNKGKARILKVAMASAFLLLLVVCIAPVSAEDCFDSNNETYIEMANGAFYNPHNDNTYYFGFTKAGGGLKAMHITNDTVADLDGAVYTGRGLSGSFNISDTSKDPGYHDSAILMFGVPGNVSTSGLNVSISASGYNWTLDATNATFPTVRDWYDSIDIGTFTPDNFLKNDEDDVINCTWRPYFDENYPMYYDQTSGTDPFKVIFIDLSLGTLNETVAGTVLQYNGSVKVDYTITGYSGRALFDVYAWNNQSKQGKSVSWTNRVIGTGSSGWTIGF